MEEEGWNITNTIKHNFSIEIIAEDWKTARTMPIHKKGDNRNCNNYILRNTFNIIVVHY